MDRKIVQLLERYPWPIQKPDLLFNDHGWFPACNQTLLAEVLSDKTGLVVELGSWLGLSTRWILERAPNAKVVAIDHWLGGPENTGDPLLPILYDQFIANCWAYKDRLVPMRTTTTVGIQILKEIGFVPDAIYVDAGHSYEAAKNDINACTSFGCPVVGDDFNPNTWDGVVKAVWEEANLARRPLRVIGSAWQIPRRESA